MMGSLVGGQTWFWLFIAQAVESLEWIIPALFLYLVAWVRFNSPPTNRSGTTFALFFSGVIFYYALIITLWLVVTISITQGIIGLGRFESLLALKPAAQGDIDQYKAAFAALVIVAASQFPAVHKIDEAARSFCVTLAAIPRQADRIAVELCQSEFSPKSRLRDHITKIISENVGAQALNFAADPTPNARFTRAVGLYWLFIAPKNGGTHLEFPAGSHARSAYAAITQLAEPIVTRAEERYEELMQAAVGYFTSAYPTKEATDGLSRATTDLSNLVCSLIARYVLYCDKTAVGRRQRLSNMGFDTSHPMPSFGPDKWAMTFAAVMLLSIAVMTLTPGTRPIAGAQVLTIAVTFALSIGFAVMGSILVAQRFIERRENSKSVFPPIAELILAGLIVAGLAVVLRIAIPLGPALLQDGGAGFQTVMKQFAERLPGVIVPFTCTISLGLLCSYLGSTDWSWPRVSAVAAIGNGTACMAAGLVLGWLLDDSVLAQFYVHPEHARAIIVLNTGLIGAAIGAIVLAVFRKSERVRKDVAERVANTPHPVLPELDANALIGNVGLASRSDALQTLGGYTRANVRGLEGSYLCFRPAFSSNDVINAYIVAVRWDDAESCLIFEEQERIDAGHTQRGRLYIPDGKPFMSLVTVERGAIRLIMVSRPDGKASARGLIMTLSNPGGMQFTPVSAPIVLKRVAQTRPQLGFIKPNSPDYAFYQQELEAVTSDYGFFATASGSSARGKPRPPKPGQEVQLTVVQ
jgi:hypothetical protein